MRVTEPSTFFEMDASVLRDIMYEWFPMAQHLLTGLFQGFTSRQRTAQGGSSRARVTIGRAHPRAQQSGRRRSACHCDLAATRVEDAGEAGCPGVGPPRRGVQTLIKFQDEAAQRVAAAPKLSAIEAADREDELSAWLDDHDVANAFQIAPTFVQAGIDSDWLDLVANGAPSGSLAGAIHWLYYTVDTELLMKEITDSATRISTLVGAAKQYSQMDRSPHQNADLHELLDSTLVMMAGKIPSGVTVVKDYADTLPPVPSYAAELNQVWTNLIDNALDAMDGQGTLTIRTHNDDDHATVQISDTGRASPTKTRNGSSSRFTTKPIGHGTGLGLDIAWRIVVNKHRGYLKVTSEPGATTFTVRLPLEGAEIGATPRASNRIDLRPSAGSGCAHPGLLAMPLAPQLRTHLPGGHRGPGQHGRVGRGPRRAERCAWEEIGRRLPPVNPDSTVTFESGAAHNWSVIEKSVKSNRSGLPLVSTTSTP